MHLKLSYLNPLPTTAKTNWTPVLLSVYVIVVCRPYHILFTELVLPAIPTLGYSLTNTFLPFYPTIHPLSGNRLKFVNISIS